MSPLITEEQNRSILRSRYGWTIIVFLILTIFVGGLIVWQLLGNSAHDWCQLAEDSSDNVRGACLTLLLSLLNIKDHAIIGLLTILGIIVASVVAVALGVHISAGGPGNTSVNIGTENAEVRGETVNINGMEKTK